MYLQQYLRSTQLPTQAETQQRLSSFGSCTSENPTSNFQEVEVEASPEDTQSSSSEKAHQAKQELDVHTTKLPRLSRHGKKTSMISDQPYITWHGKKF